MPGMAVPQETKDAGLKPGATRLRSAQIWARSNLYADFIRLALLRWREVPRPFAALATVRVLAFSSTIFRRLRPPPLPFHRFPQELVDPCLVTTPLALQPRQHIGVHADRHRPFDGTVKLPHHRPSPFPHFRRIRQIDFLVRHARQRSQFLCLLPGGLLHRSSFPAASPFAPRSSLCIPLRPLHDRYAPPAAPQPHPPFPASASVPLLLRRGPALRWHGGSSNTSLAASKLTWCFARFRRFFPSSHSKTIAVPTFLYILYHTRAGAEP